MKVFAFLSVATATAIYATTSHRRYYASDNHRDYPNFFDDPRTSSGSRSDNSHSLSDSSPDSPPPGSPSDSSQRSVRSASFSEHSDDFSNPHIRTIRSANDALNDYLEHATIIAHITNGIALQHGLMNGSIPVNDVIGELLHLVSVDVSTIANFKKDGINSLSAKLTDIKSKLTTDVTAVEDQALAWNDLIVKSMTVKSLNPKADNFFGDVEKFSKNFNFTSLTTVTDALHSAHEELEAISAYPDATNTKIQDKTYRSFKYLNTAVVEAITQVDTFNAAVLALKQYPSLKDAPTIFEPVETVLSLTKTRVGLPLIGGNDKISVTESNLQHVIDAIVDAKSSHEDTSTLQKVATRTSNPVSSNTSFTHGFPNGFADIEILMKKDVQNPWIGKITNTEGSSMYNIDNGLQPLFDVIKQLAPLEEKLVSISSVSVMDAMESWSQLHQEISGLNSDSAGKLGNLMSEIDACRYNGKNPTQDQYKQAGDLVDQAKKLGSVAKIKPIQVDGGKLKNELNDFMKSLAFSNFQDETTSLSEVKAVLEKLKSTDGLKKITNTLNTFQEAFDASPTKGLKEAADAIMKSKDTRNFPFLVDEMTLHSCLQKLKDKSVMISQTIQTSRKVRKVDTEKLAKVQSAATTLSEVAGELSGVGSIRDTMNKDVTEATTNVNKLPDSLAKSKVIGQSVNSLRSAFVLRDLEAEVKKLKTIDTSVQDWIKKSSDPKTIQQQWGNHKKEMDELEKTLGDIGSLNLNVSNLTTIGAYGTPLTALASLTSVNMNAKEKSKALDALLNDGSLKIDPTVKENIEESKKTLDQLADLDLGFASHTTQFQSAPSVFSDLQNFLTKLLQVPMSPRQPSGQVPGAQGGPGGAAAIQQGQKSKEENGITTLLLIVIIAVALLAVVAMVGGGFCGFKKYEKHIWRSNLVQWLKKHCFKNLANVKDVHSGYMQVMDANVELWRKKGTLGEEKKRLLTQSCNPDSALFVPNENKEVMVFANKVTTLGGLDFIATHAPKDPQEFWQMVLSQNPEFVVSLCGDKEMKTLNCDYYPKKVAKPKKFGDYTVALTKEETAPKDVNKRSLTVTCGEKSLQLTHLQASNWPAGDVPDDHETAFELMKTVNKSKTPVIVHCSDGNSATMSFIGIQFIFEEVRKHPIFNFGHFMHEMCERTWHPIEKYTFSAWTVLGVRKHLYDECKLAEEHKIDYDNDLKLLKDLKKEWIREDEARKEAIEATKEAERVRLANEKQKQDEEDDRRKKDQDKIDNLNKEVDELKKDKEAQQKYLETIQAKNNKIDEKNNEIEKKNKRLVEKLNENLAKLTKEEADRKRELIEWVTKNYNEDVDSHYDFHDVCVLKYMKLLKVDVDRAAANLPSGKQAFDKYCNPDTAVEVMQDGVKIPIHANYVSSKIPNCTIFIATQAPTKQGYNGYCDDTTGDFWAMIFHHDSDFIVNLCQQSEMATLAQYFHSEPNKSVTCVRYNVRTESADLVFKEEVMKRVLTVTDMESKKVKTVIHFQLLNWIDKRIPKSHYAAMEVMNVVKKSKKHVVVHCKAGVGRTMSFIGLQFVYEEISNNPQFSTVMEPMRKMREMRWEAVQSVEQSFWIYLGVVLRLVRELGLDMSYYEKQFALLPAYRRKYIDDMKAKMKKEKEEKEKAEKEKAKNKPKTEEK